MQPRDLKLLPENWRRGLALCDVASMDERLAEAIVRGLPGVNIDAIDIYGDKRRVSLELVEVLFKVGKVNRFRQLLAAKSAEENAENRAEKQTNKR